MKAITLWQPWATLVALGYKEIETRSWPTSYRGPLAIHAAKRVSYHDMFLFEDLLKGVTLPLGRVVATCELVDVQRIGYNWSHLSHLEIRLGDFSIGRYAWILRNIHPLDPPVTAQGRQGLWDWEEVIMPCETGNTEGE